MMHSIPHNLTNKSRYSIAFNFIPTGYIGYGDSALEIHYEEFKQNKIPTFIEQFKISPKLCDDMVTYFNSNKTRHAVGEVGEHHVVKHIKDSIDLCCTPKDNIYPLRDFYLAINKCMLQYQEIYPELKSHYSFDFTANYNIQYYPKGVGSKIGIMKE